MNIKPVNLPMDRFTKEEQDRIMELAAGGKLTTSIVSALKVHLGAKTKASAGGLISTEEDVKEYVAAQRDLSDFQRTSVTAALLDELKAGPFSISTSGETKGAIIRTQEAQDAAKASQEAIVREIPPGGHAAPAASKKSREDDRRARK